MNLKRLPILRMIGDLRTYKRCGFAICAAVFLIGGCQTAREPSNAGTPGGERPDLEESSNSINTSEKSPEASGKKGGKKNALRSNQTRSRGKTPFDPTEYLKREETLKPSAQERPAMVEEVEAQPRDRNVNVLNRSFDCEADGAGGDVSAAPMEGVPDDAALAQQAQKDQQAATPETIAKNAFGEFRRKCRPKGESQEAPLIEPQFGVTINERPQGSDEPKEENASPVSNIGERLTPSVGVKAQF